MKNRLYFMLLTGFLILLLTDCQKEKKEEREYPQIRTLAVDQITSAGARFNATIISGSADDITEFGFVWGRSNQLTIAYSEKILTEDAPERDEFSANISYSLEAMKDYYVRSYVKVGNLVVYGDPVKFISLGSLAPEITDFEPGSASWGDTVTIYGKNLTYQQNSVKVLFGKVNATLVKSTDEKIIVTVPHSLSDLTCAVKLNMLGNECVADKNFTLLSPGSVANVSPDIAKWGDTLVIKGVFPYQEYKISLRINKVIVTIIDTKEDQITAIFPPSTYTEKVEIELGIDNHWIASGVYISMIIPGISSVSPSSFGWDDTIVLKGNFNPDIKSNQVLFNTTIARIIYADNSSLTCIVPVLNTHSAQMVIKTGSYTITYANAVNLKGPEISSITPARSTSIGEITIKGKYFNPDNTELGFNDNWYNFIYTSITTSQIVGRLNGSFTSNGPVTVTVSTSGKSRSFSNLLTIANPAITSVSPEYCFYGEIVTVTGENFDPENIHIILCNNAEAEIISASAGEIQFKMPLQVSCGISGFSLFTCGMKIDNYNDPRITPPVINTISPQSAKPGEIITLTGDYFNPDAANNVVYFDYTHSVIAEDGDRYHINVRVPSLPTGSYNLDVSTGGSGAQAGTFQCFSPWAQIGWTFDERMDQSTIVLNNTMYLLGGLSNNNNLYQVYNCVNNQVEVYDYGIMEMHNLFNCAAFVIGNSAYFGIGNDYSRIDYTSSFYKIAIGDNSSARLNDFPGPARAGSFYFSVGSHGYVGTGINYGTLFSDFWEYDSSNDTWTKKADYPGGAAVGASAIVHNDIAYVIEGKDVYSFDPSTDQWTKKATFPGNARACGVAINDANGIYYGTGAASFDIDWDNSMCYQDFWYYSIANNSWKRLTDFPGSRRSMYGYSYNGKIYIGGGYNYDDQNIYRQFYDVVEFDPNF